MNLYYLNQKVNALSSRAGVSLYARWTLGELLHEADMQGYLIELDKENKRITITEKKGCFKNVM